MHGLFVEDLGISGTSRCASVVDRGLWIGIREITVEVHEACSYMGIEVS